jgi:hypothetical protein
MATKEEIKLLDEQIHTGVRSANPVEFNKAAAALTDYVRVQVREESFLHAIIPVQSRSSSDLTPQINSAVPTIVEEMEPGSPAAMSVGYGGQPDTYQIATSKFAVQFNRIVSPRFRQDTTLLSTYGMPLRDVVRDNAVKDLNVELDRRFLGAVDYLVGSQGSTPTHSGIIQNVALSGGLTRANLVQVVSRLETSSFNLSTSKVLCNNVTIKLMQGVMRDQFSDSLADETIRNGWTSTRLMGVDIVATIKKQLVPTNVFYTFADPKFMGRNYELVPPTLFTKQEAWNLEMFAYSEPGVTIAHAAAVAKLTISA